MKHDNSKIQALLTLGAPDNRRHWPDYLEKYGFTLEDVPALLALFADESINTLNSDRAEVWAPLYAWRILGQLASEEAIRPIVQSFDTLHEDDSALSELPGVVGMIGPAAIAELWNYWRQSGKDEFSYVMAMDALCEIAKQHSASREQIIKIYIEYMNEPNTLADTLNGLLMACLLDLKAIEAIDGIRRLFALNCVDISCAGDLEDVEIELGLRTRRSTPPPTMERIFGNENPLDAVLAGSDEDDYVSDDEDEFTRVIDHYLLLYGTDESILGSSELDGFFAALACAPETIMPSTWMPAIWGGDQFAPEWEGESEFSEFSQAILLQYNQVMMEFQIQDYEARFLESSNPGTDILIVDDWCEGFLRGLGLWREMSPQDMKQLEHDIYPIRFFGTDKGTEALQTMNKSEIRALQHSIQPCLDELYRHFSGQSGIADTPVVRAAPKVGRNDPCPCGSGKKYKKCCGLN